MLPSCVARVSFSLRYRRRRNSSELRGLASRPLISCLLSKASRGSPRVAQSKSLWIWTRVRGSSPVAPFEETTIQQLERPKNTLHIAQTNASQTRGRKENKKRWIIVSRERKKKNRESKTKQSRTMSEENDYQLFSAFLFSLLLLFFSTSLSYLIDREMGWRIE